MDLGIDNPSIHPDGPIVADDFLCEGPAPIVAVRWWGSYLMPEYNPEELPRWVPMKISWHFDNREEPYNSLPTTLLYYDLVWAQEHYYGTTAGGEVVYEYNARLNVPFDQKYWTEMQGWPVFWIDIAWNSNPEEGGIPLPPGTLWGWHPSYMHWRDWAAVSNSGQSGPWSPKWEEDMAFELMTPIPGTLLLLGSGFIGLFGLRRRFSRR